MIPNMTERAFRLMRGAPVQGCLVEFGVYQGKGLVWISRLSRKYMPEDPPIFGFDSFEGMPPTKSELASALAQDWVRGTFGDTSLEAVQRRLQQEGSKAKLLKGIFAELLPLSEYGIDKVRFAHVDADIYEGYRDALRLLTPHLQIGSVLLFDESVPPTDARYQSIRNHGQHAVREWEQRTGFNLHLIRFEWTVALCVLVDDEYLRRHTELIERLRKDTTVESLRNLGRNIFGKTSDRAFNLVGRSWPGRFWRAR